MSITTEAIGIERITELALELPVNERALLLERIHDSLLTKRELEIQEKWSKEAARRLEEIRSGKVKPIDAEIVFEEARKALKG